MLGFGKHGPDTIYGAIFDIGSGTVAVSIVATSNLETVPKVVWHHRERSAIKTDSNFTIAIKDITTAFINAALELSTNGIKKLIEYDGYAEITHMDVIISAPWTYTITKTLTYKQAELFVVTKALIEELTKTAQTDALKIINENSLFENLGLELITSETVSVRLNDYSVKNPYGQKTASLELAHVNGVALSKIIEIVNDSHNKLLPKTSLTLNTAILSFYTAVTDIGLNNTELCLLDITAEASELGIVRDGILQYVTHIPVGYYTLSRSIAALCGLPLEEALGHLSKTDTTLATTLSQSRQQELAVIISRYEDDLIELFKRTGDTLSIPKTIFVHVDNRLLPFFKDRVSSATKRAY